MERRSRLEPSWLDPPCAVGPTDRCTDRWRCRQRDSIGAGRTVLAAKFRKTSDCIYQMGLSDFGFPFVLFSIQGYTTADVDAIPVGTTLDTVYDC